MPGWSAASSARNLAGYVYDVTNSYDIAFLAGGLLLILGVLAVYFWGGHRKS